MTLSILVGIACHNRREITKRCLQLLQATKSTSLQLNICVLDDGSRDGTASMVQEEFPTIEIEMGNGEFYWAKSMSILHHKLQEREYDGFLMLNDDVKLFSYSLDELCVAVSKYPETIIVGAMMDSEERTTYSGLRCIKRGNYYRMRMQNPSNNFLNIDSFVGNFVYIPESVSSSIGFLNGEYSHHYADVEYGIRASKRGIPTLLMPKYMGICESNAARVGYLDREISLLQRFTQLNSRFCHPIKDHFKFFQNIGGKLWMYYFARSYLGKISLTLFPFLSRPIFPGKTHSVNIGGLE